MKYIVKIIALLISIVMLSSQLVSCDYINKYIAYFYDDPSLNDENEEYVFEVVYPEVSASTLVFDLTDEDLETYNKKLTYARYLFMADESGTEEKFKDCLYELLSIEARIETQRDIAYLQYFYDTSDSQAWDNYLYAYSMREEIHDSFWIFYSAAKRKDTAFAKIFMDVVEEEYGDALITVTPEADDYAYQMEVLEGEYNELVSEGATDEEIFETYKEYMVAANRYALCSYTGSYYEYASKYTYYRDDTPEQREMMREYTKQYLIPLYKSLWQKSVKLDNRLTRMELDMSNRYLYGPYNAFGKDYLGDYFSSLPTASGSAMASAFEDDRVLIGYNQNSYNTAMVYSVGNTPICYFHSDLINLDTVSHELGHYYARLVGDSDYYSYSIKETHSTANTMLMFSFLSEKIGSRSFKAAEAYMLSNWVYQIILSVIKDEFDEQIYTRDPLTLTLSDFETIISGLIEEYGVSDISSVIEEQLMTYWKRQGILYPVSNYCYAIAFTASLQIYLISKDDYAQATEIYRKIVEEVDETGEFLPTIINAGLTSPYDEQTYVTLNELYDPFLS